MSTQDELLDDCTDDVDFLKKTGRYGKTRI